jgi:hypothetical protein
MLKQVIRYSEVGTLGLGSSWTVSRLRIKIRFERHCRKGSTTATLKTAVSRDQGRDLTLL